MRLTSYLKSPWFWPILALVSTLLRLLFVYWPWGAEYLYSQGFFLGFRFIWDYLIGFWLPFAGFYLFIILVFVALVWAFRIYFRAWGGRTWAERGGALLLGLGQSLCLAWVWFLWAWGFNYARLPVEDYLNLEVRALEGPLLLSELRRMQDSCRQTRALIPQADTQALKASHFPSELETPMRLALEAKLQALNYPSVGRVRGRFLPAGWLLGFGASGIYWPFTAEGHLDGGLHPIQQPFTLAHELAHGYGFGDEADCNFLAYLACENHPNPAVRYSGFLTYRRYLLAEVYRAYPDFIDSLRQTTPAGMMADQIAIRQALDAYPEWFPKVQRLAYDTYLKSQGVSEGILSYNRMILLVYAYYKKNR